MSAQSAGILMYKRNEKTLLVLLIHPGGPIWARKDNGAWSIPKGERAAGEDFEATARREFAEELGAAPRGPLRPLGRIRQLVERRSRPSPWREISRSSACEAISFRWNGRLTAEESSPSRRSIAPHGSHCRRRAGRSSQVSSPCSTVSKCSGRTSVRDDQQVSRGNRYGDFSRDARALWVIGRLQLAHAR
jgi:hypothetical protein